MTHDKNHVDLIGMAYQNARVEGVRLRVGNACRQARQKRQVVQGGTAQAEGAPFCAEGSGYLKVIAPAKVNLYLEVGAKRADGYHPVENVMHSLLLHDVLYMRCLSAQAYAYETGVQLKTSAKLAGESRPASADGLAGEVGLRADAPSLPGASYRASGLKVHLTCTGVGSVEAPEIPEEKNIVYKAIVAFAQAVGRNEEEVMDVHLEKHIPHQAGLGGGSADAAAALVGAAKLWGVDSTDPRLEAVARTLGADVAFFLRGGCALYDGVGENFVRALATRKDVVVLIKPSSGLSTAAVYNAFDANPTMPTAEQKQALRSAGAADQVPLFNGLAAVAESLDENLAAIRAWALFQAGVKAVLLTGSGSCSFVICENADAALAVTAAAQAQGWWAASTYFADIRAMCGAC